MVICPRCRSANPDDAGLCPQCGQLAGAADSVLSSLDTTTPGKPRTETVKASAADHSLREPVTIPSKATAKEGTDVAMPALGQVASPARTVLNRPATEPANATPAPEGSAALSVLESNVTKMNTKPAHRPPSGPQAPLTLRTPSSEIDRPARPTALVDAIAPEKPMDPPRTIVPKLVVLRGERLHVAYPIYEGKNVVGRFAEKPVDIDLEDQETLERIRISRHHALIHFDNGELRIEDLNSLNGTWVNSAKIHSGQQRRLAANDVIQVGTVQLRLVIEQPA